MANFCLKKPSKRQPARRRYKILKKIREHNRKKRKEAKKLANKPQRKLIPIPNICPFKEEILKDAERYKAHQELEKAKARELLKAEREAKKAKNVQELVDSAQERQIGIDKEKEREEEIVKKGVGNVKTYYREFQKVVTAADVILEIVDARDPLGTRCPTIEETVRAAPGGKKLVLVLNKADLVPRDILDKWLKYLRRRVPCIPFKCSTQSQAKKLGRKKLKPRQEVSSNSICVGAEGLMSLLANYSRNNGVKTAIRVGVVGLPNVGKSSLINSLKRSRACKVGSVPGVTRNLQEVQLDTKIKLLDSPGLAFASSTDPQAALKNAVSCSDPMEPAEIIIQRANKKEMMELYLINDYSSSTEFLSSLARRYGRFKKKGVVDLEAAAKILIADWNHGKIHYYTVPPEDSKEYDISSSIVSSDVPEFDLNAYDAQVFKETSETMDTSVTTDSLGEMIVKGKKTKNKVSKENEEVKPKGESQIEVEGNLRLNKMRKVQAKKARKKKAKQERSAAQLATVLEDIKIG